MRVRVLYFAILRERLGRTEETLDLADHATVADALAVLVKQRPTAAEWLPRVRVAVGEAFAQLTDALHDGDEVALIPPVSGGSSRAAIAATPLSIDACVSAVMRPDAGAVTVFIGVVRNASRGEVVTHLEYEAYESMACAELERMIDAIELEVPGVKLHVAHRTGTLQVGDLAVVLAASAPHRNEAFVAARELIERLKRNAPIWKKEFAASGAVWVGLGP